MLYSTPVYIVSGSGDGTCRVWDLASRQQVGQPLTGHTASVCSVAVSGDAEGGWSVVYEEDDPALAPAASNRSVKVVAVDRLETAVPSIERARADAGGV